MTSPRGWYPRFAWLPTWLAKYGPADPDGRWVWLKSYWALDLCPSLGMRLQCDTAQVQELRRWAWQQVVAPSAVNP